MKLRGSSVFQSDWTRHMEARATPYASARSQNFLS